MLGLLLIATACRKSAPAAGPPPVAVSDFELAERHFESGDYASAAKLYAVSLLDAGPELDRETALFRAALSCALSEPPHQDLESAAAHLETLMLEYPQGRYTPQAKLIRSLVASLSSLESDNRQRQARIRELSTELERLKEVDLKRRTVRPPGPSRDW